ncbi:MAG: LD-carboxypeptidase [Acidobacteria bacterium]|nr:LD-carboxypeptidase [Acidobacteriota bacterium]
MKKLRKPVELRRGDTIGIVAPSSPVELDLLETGARELEAIGYHVLYARNLFTRWRFFAGRHQKRAEAFLELLKDPGIAAIFCARGGYGSNYVVEYLASRSLLPQLKRLQPKIVMGYSDVTSLLLFLHQNLGWVTFQGPMLTKDFAEGEMGYDRPVLEKVLSGSRSGFTLEATGQTLRPGQAEGRLLGGCLPMMVSTLGTPQEIDTQGTLLLIEDVNERAFRIDRMLFQLRRAGKFRQVRGVVFGLMLGCGQASTPVESLREIILDAFQGLDIPIVFGMRFGHTTQKCLTLPLGVRARLSAGEAIQLTLLEPAVSPRPKPAPRKTK